MEKSLLHVFRNSPYGRENLLQSAYTCQKLQLPLDIYLPEEPHFVFFFSRDTVQIDLDMSYLQSPGTARSHVEGLLENCDGLYYRFVEPATQIETGFPTLSPKCSLLTCPRSMTESTSRIGLNHIGPKVRRIVQTAPFPILMPSFSCKPWTKLTVLFGGSRLAAQALKLANGLHQTSQIPLSVISFGEQKTLQKQAEKSGVADIIANCDWQVIPGAPTAEKLFAVPHDALVILGAYGHGTIRSLFGSTMEMVQSELPNPLLIVGPEYQP